MADNAGSHRCALEMPIVTRAMSATMGHAQPIANLPAVLAIKPVEAMDAAQSPMSAVTPMIVSETASANLAPALTLAERGPTAPGVAPVT